MGSPGHVKRSATEKGPEGTISIQQKARKDSNFKAFFSVRFIVVKETRSIRKEFCLFKQLCGSFGRTNSSVEDKEETGRYNPRWSRERRSVESATKLADWSDKPLGSTRGLARKKGDIRSKVWKCWKHRKAGKIYPYKQVSIKCSGKPRLRWNETDTSRRVDSDIVVQLCSSAETESWKQVKAICGANWMHFYRAGLVLRG